MIDCVRGEDGKPINQTDWLKRGIRLPAGLGVLQAPTLGGWLVPVSPLDSQHTFMTTPSPDQLASLVVATLLREQEPTAGHQANDASDLRSEVEVFCSGRGAEQMGAIRNVGIAGVIGKFRQVSN